MGRLSTLIIGWMVVGLACAATLPGDGNADGIVDFQDYEQFATCLAGPDVTSVPTCTAFDFEPDGDVDLLDFAVLAQHWLEMTCEATATASSVENNDPEFAADRAVDGDFTTRWASNFADNQWLRIDFGQTRSFDGLRIYWETAYARAYRVWVSNDGSSWTDVYYTAASDGYRDTIELSPQFARYLRIDCLTRATEWGNSIWEVLLESDDYCQTPPPDTEQRIEQLVQAMTLEEKASFVYGQTAMDLRPIPRLGIPSLKLADGPLGIRWDQATAFPASIAMAATWDFDLLHAAGVAIGREYRNKGRQVWLGPCMGIIRVPQGGRNFETFGEDPFFNGHVAAAMIQGAQSQGVVACAKHFACNNQEYERFTINIQVDERALREIYLPVFETAVRDGGAWAVMSAYNRLNGPYCTASEYLQRTILKDEWGFKGFVVSDWGAVHSTIAPALYGLDLEMDGDNPTGTYWGNGQLLSVVQSGTVSEALLDDKVRRILRAMFHTDMVDEPWPAPDVELVEHRALVRQLGDAGIVLLKNEGNVLPLDRTTPQTVAVIGPNSQDARLGGGGSSSMWPYYSVSPWQGLQALAGPNITLTHAIGTLIDGTTVPAAPTSYLTTPDGVSPGLWAEYFNNTSLQGTPALSRIDANVEFWWGAGSPGPGVNADGFSVRWSGRLQVPTTGTYQLGMTSDDGVRLYLDGVLIIDDWNNHGATLTHVDVYLEAGVPHDLVIEYYENTGDAVAVLSCFNADAALAEAIATAASADVAIVFAGLSSAYESEGYDRPTMDLDAAQVNLIQSVAAANPNTVVVMIAGSQVGMDTWVDGVPALVQAWYLGQEGGNAIADVLFGDVNPSGKLPMTFVRRWEDHPCHANYPGPFYSEEIYVGYRYFDTFGVTPLFPFGHGLSYTTFAYRDLVLDTSHVGTDGHVTVSCTVENTGTRAGAEVVQVYVRDPVSSVQRPYKELKGFRKVTLAPGEATTVSITLDVRAFSYYDVVNARWTVEPGQFEIFVGSSSRDLRLSGTITYP